MRIYDRKLTAPADGISIELLEKACSSDGGLPIRLIVTNNRTDPCEIEVDFVDFEGYQWGAETNIFSFRKRTYENDREFNVVLMIPTGIGCELGGHEGDANPVAKLLASACDTLITHPNVVNSTDYNEMGDNTLYVEGSTLTRVLMGQVGLQRVRSNKVLLIVEKGSERYVAEMINAASVARITLGMAVDVRVLNDLTDCTISLSPCGRAAGILQKMENLFLPDDYAGYDAVALATHIERNTAWSRSYFSASKLDDRAVNPTGGIEAMMTHCLSLYFNKPFAHAPSPQEDLYVTGVLDPRISGFTGSIRHIHCCLKGLQKSPRIVAHDRGLTVEDVSCLVIPDGCIGLPVLACAAQGIPVIAVENRNIMHNDLETIPFRKDGLFKARNYLEAVGLLHVLRNGLSLDAVTRPIAPTRVY